MEKRMRPNSNIEQPSEDSGANPPGAVKAMVYVALPNTVEWGETGGERTFAAAPRVGEYLVINDMMHQVVAVIHAAAYQGSDHKLEVLVTRLGGADQARNDLFKQFVKP